MGTDFANLLQLVNDKNIFEQYDLSDIKQLLVSLTKLQEYNLENYVELAHFEWSCMDNSKNAKETAMKGIEKAKEKINELQNLMNSIDIEK